MIYEKLNMYMTLGRQFGRFQQNFILIYYLICRDISKSPILRIFITEMLAYDHKICT